MTESDVKTEEKPTHEGDVKPTENGEGAEKTAEEPAKEMRAVVLTGFGGLKTVRVQKKAEPALAEGEVLIRVKACGLNFQDLMVRLGLIDAPPKTPFILGMECAGDIEVVADGVDGFKVGDRVAALPEYRAWAELVAVPAKFVYKIPDNLSYQDAAAITLNFAVAYILLFDLGGLMPGKKILVHSAGGGVGQAIVQLSHTVSDVTVFGVAGKGKHEALKDSVEHLLERGSDFAAEVRKVVPEGVDMVLDCGDDSSRGCNLLAPLGRYILFGMSHIVTGETRSFFPLARTWLQGDKVSRVKLFEENKGVLGFNIRHLLYQQSGADYVRKVVEKVYNLYREKKIKPNIDSSWAWEDIAEAMQKMHDRKNIGKLILDPSMAPKPKLATPVKEKKKGNSVDKEEKKKEEGEEKKKEEGEEKNGQQADSKEEQGYGQ